MRTPDIQIARQMLRTLRDTRAKRPAKLTAGVMPPRSGMHDEDIDELTERVIGAAIAAHSALGPGLLESAYRDCLAIELRHLNIPFELEVRFPIVYRGVRVRNSLRLDVLVGRRLVVEAQVITYLKISDCPAGLILNFNAPRIREGLQRVDRPDIYARKRAARQAQSRI